VSSTVVPLSLSQGANDFKISIDCLKWKYHENPRCSMHLPFPLVGLQCPHRIKIDLVLMWARTSNSFVFCTLPSSMELRAS